MNIRLGEKQFDISRPISVSRPVMLHPEVKMSNAFSLPKFSETSFEIGEFIGDIEKGGSCNVRILSYSPHNLTHIETSLHIVKNGHSLLAMPRDKFTGLLYLIDLTDIQSSANNLITIDDVESKLIGLDSKCKFIAFKTIYSNIESHYDFTDTSPMALDPKLTEYISKEFPEIVGLFLDLPSADVENDGGKLLAHRNFFELPEIGIQADNHPMKFISELGYFNLVDEGYYYCITTPPKLQTDASITDIYFYPQMSD